MRVLALTHRTPFPPDKGDKIRTHHLLTRLAKRCEVHLLAFAEPPADVAHTALLRRHFASVSLVPIDLRWQKVKALPRLLGLRPMTLSVFGSARFEAEVDRAVRELAPDAILAESSSMAPYALRHPEVPLVMDFVDVDSAKWRAYADEAAFPMRAVYQREASTLEDYEREVARRAVISAVTADREKVLLAAIAPGCDARTLANGVDTDYFAPAAAPATDASAVFFGAMDYHANVEAAVFLVREVMPRVRARYPGFRVVIAGSRPSAEVRALAAVDGVTVTGYVDDIRSHVTGCAVCVIPLRVARGVQNKVLEAMAMGVPVVCSPAAAEGIEAEPGTQLLVAPYGDHGGPMAEAVLALLHDRGRASAIAAAARHRVEGRYGWEPRSDELHGMLAEASARRVRRA
jgi:sugar transferase (PEP-CTERM/EpsH1 system associated)